MSTAAAREKRYALLSADGWAGVELDGVEVGPDGRLRLLSVPALDDPVHMAPAAVEPSGIALDGACGLYVSDGERAEVVRIALDCDDRLVVGVDGSPAGLAVGPFGWLLVADPPRQRVLVYTRHLELRGEWTAGLTRPVAVAWAGGPLTYVLDVGPPAVVRSFDREGRPGPPLGAPKPHAIAGADGTVFVADGDVDTILAFDGDGIAVGAPLVAGVRSLAVSGERLYAAGGPTGAVGIFDLQGGPGLGSIANFSGPVSALAAAADGTIYVKTGPGPEYKIARAGAARASSGTVTTRRLDAGEQGGWFRAAADAELAAGTRVRLLTREGAGAWEEAAGTDTLLSGTPHELRLRLSLERDDIADQPTATPVVAELRAETEGEPYLDYLPAVYARDAEPEGFLRRLLALVQGVFDDREAAADEVARHVDPVTAPPERLPRLATWQALDVPKRLLAIEEADGLRDLLAELPRLYERRGTPLGVVRAAEMHTGVRPALFEHFRSRGIWMLGGPAALGVDTMLPGTKPGGITVGSDVVGASGPEDDDAWGAVLFEETAHRFTAVVPAAALNDDGRAQLERVLDAEKPAHTAYHLCLTEPRLRVGMQAVVGLDTIVAGPDEALALGDRGRLGLDARTTAEPEDGPGAVGRRGRLGVDTLLG